MNLIQVYCANKVSSAKRYDNFAQEKQLGVAGGGGLLFFLPSIANYISRRILCCANNSREEMLLCLVEVIFGGCWTCRLQLNK